MRFFSRNLAAVFVVVVVINTLVGCGAVSPRPKALKDIKTTVPGITGLPLINPRFPGPSAQRTLAIVGLQVGEVTLEETKDRSLHGQVFDQNPAPGTPARGGTTVDVKVYQFVPPEKEGSPAEAK